MPALLATLVLVAVTAGIAAPAAAHGGSFQGGKYTGPADMGVPGPGLTEPPTNPQGAAAPGPAVAPQPLSAPTTVGVGNMIRGAATRSLGLRGQSSRSSTTGSSFEPGANYTAWEFWWEFNNDRYLDLKARLIKTTNVSGSLGVLTGRGRKSRAVGSRRPSPQQIEAEVVPTLETLLTSTDDRDILDSSILALSRVARPDLSDRVRAQAEPLLSHAELSVRASACLALGVLGSADAVDTLSMLLADGPAGRRLSGGQAVHWLVRSFAALSLGMIGDDDAAAALLAALPGLSDADKDVKVCVLVGLGLMPEDNPRRAEAVERLTALLDDRRMDLTVQSYVPTSLGKLGDRSAVEPLLATFADERSGHLVRQSCAIALGRLATTADHPVIAALTEEIATGRDTQTRHFAFIALASIGGRDASPAVDDPVHAHLVSLFSRELTHPSRSTNRSWAALAAALYAREHVSAQPDIIDRLMAAYRREKDPSYKAASAIALGLLGARSVGDELLDDFVSSRDDDFRGYAAVALGMLKHTEAAEVLRSRIRDKASTPTFRLQTAVALGLMGDQAAIAVLIETLEGSETLGVSSAVARALGLIGDRSALAPLITLALDGDKTDLVRAFAAVALGMVGEATDLPFNAVISEDNNYRARVPAMDEVLDVL